MDIREFARIQSRRSFFRTCGLGLETAALAHLLARDGQRRHAHRSAGAEEAAFRAQGEERHLYVHGRRAEPDRPVRSQAGTRENAGAVAARVDDQAVEARVHQAERRGARQPAQVRALRQVRDGAIGLHSAHRHVRRRHLPGALDVHRRVQSSSGPVAADERHDAGRPADVRRVDGVRTGERVREPAGLRGAEFGRGHERRRIELHERLSAVDLPGRACSAASGDPILYLSNPAGSDARNGSAPALDALRDLNQEHLAETGDVEIASRINSYELAFRMQMAAPELLDFSKESQATLDMYGIGKKPMAPFATNCLLARRMVERGVRFVMLMHASWDQHTYLNRDLKKNCDITDQPTAALIKDLKQRGLLDSTLIVWGGEFGRTPMVEIREDQRSGERGPRSPSARLQHVAGGRRHQRRAGGRQDRRSRASTSSKTRSTCTTCRRRYCSAWASITRG